MLIPALVKAFEKNTSANDSVYTQLTEPVTLLKDWDLRCGVNSVATTLAVEWGQKLLPKMVQSNDEDDYQYVDQVTERQILQQQRQSKDLIEPCLAVVNELKNKFGNWKISWGTINRFQRMSGDIDQQYNDAQPSLPVGFAASTWGMLPSLFKQLLSGY